MSPSYTTHDGSERAAVIDALTQAELVALYRALVRTRAVDEALARLVREGALAKAWPSTGEEALAVGPARALVPGPGGDVIAPVIRNSGACHEFGMPVASVVRAYLGTADAPSLGRDGHYGDAARGVLAPISHLGDMVPVVAGVALTFRLRGEPRLALSWIGDGTARAGTTHEGLNLAAVQRVRPSSSSRTTRWRSAPRWGVTGLRRRRGARRSWIGPARTGCGAPRWTATTCSTATRRPASPPSGAAPGRGR